MKSSKTTAQQRLLVAQTAARLMAEGGAADFASARRKAADQLGLQNRRNLPDNNEIELALQEYQQLFQADSQGQHLRELRQTALQAMKLLTPFTPRLVGPVLLGSADQYSTIYLHLFADTAEEVAIFLMEHKIPHQQDERRVRYAKGQEERQPMFRFIAGEHTLELTVFSPLDKRRKPLSPVDNQPMRRADRDELMDLMGS